MELRPMKRLADKTKVIKTNEVTVIKVNTITEEEYLKALDIVKTYREQVLENPNLTFPDKISQETFIDLSKWLNVKTIDILETYLLEKLKDLGITKINTSNFDIKLFRYVNLEKMSTRKILRAKSYQQLKALFNSHNLKY
jgi:hypothetical protein